MLQRTRTTARGPDYRDAEVGRRIRAQRLSKGLSQTDLGRRLGVSFQQVQKYEKGFNRVGAGRLQAIAEVLEVPITFFYAAETTEPLPAGQAAHGDAESPFGCLSTAGAIQLVRAYARIEDSSARRALVEVAEQMANFMPGERASAN
jgi:transcriptional regulator with XRE-family HTH domain